MRKQYKKPARDGQVLLEMQELIAVAKLGVEHEPQSLRKSRRGPARPRGSDSRAGPARPQPASSAMARGKNSPGTPKASHVSHRRGIAGDLAHMPRAGKMPASSTAARSARRTRAKASLLVGIASACNRSLMFGAAVQSPFRDRPAPRSRSGIACVKAATFSLALSICPVST